MVTASSANYFNKLRNRWNPRTGKQLILRECKWEMKRKRRHNKWTVFSLITVSTQAPPCVRPKPKQLLIICSTVWSKKCPWLWFWICSCVLTIRQLADAAVAAAAAAHSCQSFRFLHLQTCSEKILLTPGMLLKSNLTEKHVIQHESVLIEEPAERGGVQRLIFSPTHCRLSNCWVWGGGVKRQLLPSCC